MKISNTAYGQNLNFYVVWTKSFYCLPSVIKRKFVPALNIPSTETLTTSMKKIAEKTASHFRISLDVAAPNHVNTAHLNSNDVQVAFNYFLAQNPQILVRFFEKLENAPLTQQNTSSTPPLPRLNKAQREAILANIKITPYPDEDANSEEWIKEIQSSRLDKDNHPPFFDGIVEDK